MLTQPNRSPMSGGEAARSEVSIPMNTPRRPQPATGFGFDVFGPSRIWVEVVEPGEAERARREAGEHDLVNTLADGRVVVVHARPLPMVV
jgi:hypothetical protein